MTLINPTLFKPRNLAIIGAIAIVTHALAKPLYKVVGQKG